MKIVFFGSDDFAATHLKFLLDAKHQVVACVTQPDTRQGRGMNIVMSPIKTMADVHGLLCLQPATLKDPLIVEQLKSLGADIFVVVAYGKLLPQEVLDIPRIFCINVHGSLLPKYRGAAPINWAILNGDKKTGVTIQKMALALDAGDIISQEHMSITDDTNAQVLRNDMAEVGAKLLVQTLNDITANKHSLTPQVESQSSYASKLTKSMGKIDWSNDACFIFNQVRGLQPWPGAYTSFNGKTLKILKAVILEDLTSGRPGEVLQIDKNGFTVACGKGALLIKQVHLEASKIMSAVSFVAGHHLRLKDILNR